MASLMEIMQLCRLCLVKDQVNIPIFEEQGDIRQIFLKISACLPVKVSREDDLPKKICDECSYKLEILYQFWNTSANSEKQLLKWLSQVGAEKGPASDKVAVAPVQPHSMPSDGVILKQEVVDLADSHSADEIAPDDLNVSSDAQDYIMQQQQLTYQPISFQFQQDGFAEGEGATNASGPSATVTSEATEAAPKRKRRAAAMKALPAHIDSEEEDEDDVDMVETKIAKTEEQSDDSGGEDPEPTAFVGVPSTSTDNEQPGPSGVGKGSAEAPLMMESQKAYCATNTENAQNSRATQFQRDLNIDNSIGLPILKEKPESTINSLDVSNPDISLSPLIITPKLSSCLSEDVEHEKYSCMMCSDIFSDKKSFHKHLVEHNTNYQPYTCEICSKTFPSLLHLKNHMYIHSPHSERVSNMKESFTCSICKKNFNRKRNYIKHLTNVHTDSRPYFCEVCKENFKSQSQLTMHKKIHTSKLYPCKLCDMTFHSKFTLSSHAAKHEDYPINKCEVCSTKFCNTSLLMKHIRDTHGKMFQCTTCNKKFYTRQWYTKHEQAHREVKVKQHACTLCSKKFINHENLRKHLLKHKGESFKQGYMCEICGKTYTMSMSLKNHQIHQHIGVRSLLCTACGKKFVTKRDLYCHMPVHSGEKRHCCDVCGKTFIQKTSLVMHRRIHTGEKPYKCNLCEKGFTQKASLVLHMRSHTGERPYKCNLCESAYVSTSLLNAHKKRKHQITK